MNPTPEFHEIDFNGGALVRGFWLYVWEVTLPTKKKVFYVGRTGDSSSLNAQSPFNRMGQHLGHAATSNMLRKYLTERKPPIALENCRFRLISYGPILAESNVKEAHRARRDVIAAIEKALAESMSKAGYEVMNTVSCRKKLDESMFNEIRTAFFEKLPKTEKP